MRVTLIAALARDRVLGREGGIPWRLPADLGHFKRTTMGHFLVLGRRTWESIGRALPGRKMVVITRRPDLAVPEGVTVAGSLEEALERAETAGESEVFIAGGGEIYRQALPRADRLDLTEVDLEVEGDTYFPEIDEEEWREISREEHPADDRNPHACRFRVLERRGDDKR
jgi:dihydrofolate reductase